MEIRALVVDDEPWARKRIAQLLRRETEIEIVGECADGESAVHSILSLSPQVVFLDVQMPEMDGFEVLQALGSAKPPLVVFVTAYDKYAIRAFDVHAVDYLLKPFDSERFRKTLDRVKDELRRGEGGRDRNLENLLKTLSAQRPYLRRLAAKTGSSVVFLRAEDVDWIEASGNYVTLHIGKESHLIRETMSGLEPKLNPRQFVRIHRGTIVNMDRIKELQPWFSGERVLSLKDGTQLRVGRAFRGRLRRIVDNRPF